MIDLHLHTTASDGALTPKELLIKAEKLGLEMIAISDHYTMLGYDDLKDPAVRELFSGKILTACEFGAHYNGSLIEILGYGIDPDEARNYLAETYPPLKEKMRREMEILIKTYRERGFPFDEQAVRDHFDREGITIGARGAIKRELNKYPENIARYFNPLSETDEKSFLRNEVGNPKSPYFLSYDCIFPSAEEICTFIHKMGGKAIIAHPGIYDPAVYQATEQIILEAKPDGIEVWHANHTPEQREVLMGLCRKYGLIFSGGSDFHNKQREARGNVMGMAPFASVFPVDAIKEWTEPLLKI